MKIFLSYGEAADQVTALRLQALGTANGLTIYVPPAHTRRGAPLTDAQTLQKLAQAEIVLGVVTGGLAEACRQELNTAMTLGKNLIVMTSLQFYDDLQPVFSKNLVLVDPEQPADSERGIVQHLKQIDAQNDAKKALLALGTLVLGLMLLAPAEHG